MLTTIISTAPVNGTATIANNVISYTPTAGYDGTDSIGYTVSDGNGGTATATISITVTAGNTPPTAQSFAISVDEDSNNNSIDLGPRINDSDFGDMLTTIISTAPVNGTATIANNVISYTPTAGYDGTDSIGYTVQDGNGGSATATISITVNALLPTTLVWDLSTGTLSGPEGTIVQIRIEVSGNGNAQIGSGAAGFRQVCSGAGCPNPPIDSFSITLDATGERTFGGNHFGSSGSAIVE